jgi:hypothetical protein
MPEQRRQTPYADILSRYSVIALRHLPPFSPVFHGAIILLDAYFLDDYYFALADWLSLRLRRLISFAFIFFFSSAAVSSSFRHRPAARCLSSLILASPPFFAFDELPFFSPRRRHHAISRHAAAIFIRFHVSFSLHISEMSRWVSLLLMHGYFAPVAGANQPAILHTQHIAFLFAAAFSPFLSPFRFHAAADTPAAAIAILFSQIFHDCHFFTARLLYCRDDAEAFKIFH